MTALADNLTGGEYLCTPNFLVFSGSSTQIFTAYNCIFFVYIYIYYYLYSVFCIIIYITESNLNTLMYFPKYLYIINYFATFAKQSSKYAYYKTTFFPKPSVIFC
jgi:hypothetical protein